jgi:hypothetical protein
MSFKAGILAQLLAEKADIAGTDETSADLFFRRLRFVTEFTLGERLTVFLQTDNPRLGEASDAGGREAGDAYIQDLAVTWEFSPGFLLDGGMLLLEPTYNHNQSSSKLLATDSGPYTFVESGPMGERAGRDYGLRARGYLLDDHLEYRAGVYQGSRGANAAADLRFIGRLMYSFFTPHVGLFYTGTSLGRTRTLAIGASLDRQEGYGSVGLDLFWDQPVGEDGFVFQADYLDLDGGSFLAAVPEQTNLLFEAGFYFARASLQPYLQYATRNFAAASGVDEARLTAGLAWYLEGHSNNVKLSWTRIEPDAGDARDQIQLQWQIYRF